MLDCCCPALRLPIPPSRRRGAHTFFLRQGEVARWGGYTVNLIHYEDAARMCADVLQVRAGALVGQGCRRAGVGLHGTHPPLPRSP